jgi:2-methylisocitrate lyase-like PEP mutase family enzyme
VSKPINIVMSAADPDLTTQQLADAGVKRISVGGTLSRLAFAAVRDAAVAMRDQGSYQWVRQAIASKDLKVILEK